MSIRHCLLAILAEGDCYGLQLKQEFERRTGGTWQLNVGQVYTTLDRLERDGFAARSGTDARGQVTYRATPAGAAEARAWFESPIVKSVGTREELVMKLTVALTLPGADVARIVSVQRDALRTALARPRDDAQPLPLALASDWLDRTLEAELDWLDACERALTVAEPHGILAELPRRGRPASR